MLRILSTNWIPLARPRLQNTASSSIQIVGAATNSLRIHPGIHRDIYLIISPFKAAIPLEPMFQH